MKITNGLEALMSYDSDDSSVDSDKNTSSYESIDDNRVPEHGNCLELVITVISELLTALLQLQQRSLTPFNVTPLITLMNDIMSAV